MDGQGQWTRGSTLRATSALSSRTSLFKLAISRSLSASVTLSREISPSDAFVLPRAVAGGRGGGRAGGESMSGMGAVFCFKLAALRRSCFCFCGTGCGVNTDFAVPSASTLYGKGRGEHHSGRGPSGTVED